MSLIARLKSGETLGDRVIKVDHAGEHGAICIYTAQRWLARWRAPEMVRELDDFLAHERGHRERFGAELHRRGVPRCRSYFWCGVGGFALGCITGLAGRQAIAATTVAIESVVLRHMREQLQILNGTDPPAVAILHQIIGEEQAHHDVSVKWLEYGAWPKLIMPIVSRSTEAVIWLGMRL